MLCYKDRSFCSQNCANKECSRNINEYVIGAAKRCNLPIDMNDFKTDDCGYLPLTPNDQPRQS